MTQGGTSCLLNCFGIVPAAQENPGDQKAAEDEEELDTEERCAQGGKNPEVGKGRIVVNDDCEDGEGPHCVQLRHVGETFPFKVGRLPCSTQPGSAVCLAHSC